MLQNFLDKFPEITGGAAAVISFFAWSLSEFGFISDVLQILVLIGSVGVSFFTIRYLIVKTKKLKQ